MIEITLPLLEGNVFNASFFWCHLLRLVFHVSFTWRIESDCHRTPRDVTLLVFTPRLSAIAPVINRAKMVSHAYRPRVLMFSHSNKVYENDRCLHVSTSGRECERSHPVQEGGSRKTRNQRRRGGSERVLVQSRRRDSQLPICHSGKHSPAALEPLSESTTVSVVELGEG